MNEKTATAAMAGPASGRPTWRKDWNGVAPSSSALSNTCAGSDLNHCRNRKMKNALPNRCGTMSGR